MASQLERVQEAAASSIALGSVAQARGGFTAFPAEAPRSAAEMAALGGEAVLSAAVAVFLICFYAKCRVVAVKPDA